MGLQIYRLKKIVETDKGRVGVYEWCLNQNDYYEGYEQMKARAEKKWVGVEIPKLAVIGKFQKGEPVISTSGGLFIFENYNSWNYVYQVQSPRKGALESYTPPIYPTL
jgi:hypothetical protein